MTRAAGALLVALSACGAAAAPAPTCADDLQGTYRAPDGGRWMVLDNRPRVASLEVYPLFPDAADVIAPPGIVVAPRVIDLHPAGEWLAGDVLRRYAHGADHCDARAPAHVTACTRAGLELVLADPVAPLAYAPCTVPPAPPSRREIWNRE